MDTHKQVEQLVRFINRETTREEDREVLAWVMESDGNRTELRQLYETWMLSRVPQQADQINIDRAWAEFSAKRLSDSRRENRRTLPFSMRVAASILILIAVGVGSFEAYRMTENGGMANQWVKVEVPAGEKSKVVLADGSRVWLNSESVLKYNTADPRKVDFVGEAYFEVAKDARHPFEVHTESGIDVRVLGTQFNLRNYPDENRMETTLDEGKVELYGSRLSGSVTMKPGEQAVFAENQMEIKKVDSRLFSVWRDNELKFVDISFAELVPRIERWYGVKIQLDPRLASRDRFTLTIKTESIRELFTMMQLTSTFKYQINGSQIVLKAN